MENLRGRKKKVLRGGNYARLHGGSTSNAQVSLNPSASVPSNPSDQSQNNRQRVRFRDDLFNLAGASSKPEQVMDPELQAVMQQYGLQDSDLAANLPAPQKPKNYSEHTQRLAAFGVSLSNRLSHFVVAYPFIVLRRQCQVNNIGAKYHLAPFGLVSVALNMQRAQGVTCLWKGIGSYFVVSVMSVCAETALSELPPTKLPREISSNTSLKSLLQHFILKTCSIILILPFYSAHLVESVQSEMVNETPGVFSCVFDGFRRLFGRRHSPRMLPFHRILLPTLSYSLAKYVMALVLQQVALQVIQFISRRRRRTPAPSTPPPTPVAEKETSLVNVHYPELISSLIAELITDVIMFPMETAVNRINIQGTRTIIDNTDTGRGFLPVSSRYEGFVECVTNTVATEGYSGLYRGFGALMLQYSLRYAVARLTKFALALSC